MPTPGHRPSPDDSIPPVLAPILQQEARLRLFLRQTQHLLGNALETDHHQLLTTRADHWKELAGAKALLGHPPGEVLQALRQALDESLAAVELGFLVPPERLHGLWSTALLLRQRNQALFLATLPERWWLPAPESRPFVVEIHLAFALFRQDDAVAARILEVFDELCFDPDPARLVTHDVLRARRVHPVLAALLRRDAKAFLRTLPDLLADPHFCRRTSEFDLGPNIAAAAFFRLAQWRQMPVALNHPELPPSWLFPE